MLSCKYYLRKNTFQESIDAYQQIILKIFMTPNTINPETEKCCISSATSDTAVFKIIY